MNSFITFACLLAVVGVSHGYGYGPIISSVYPAAVSTQNLVKAAPIPIVKTILSPIVTAPVIKTVPIISPIGLGPYGYNGLGSYGYNGLGSYGYNGLGSYGYNGIGLNGYGINGLGLKGLGGKLY